MGPYVRPATPNNYVGAGQKGSLGAIVEVRSVNESPEPASLVLAALGACGLGAGTWRLWRKGIGQPQGHGTDSATVRRSNLTLPVY
jgi:hypothetical protein